MSINIPRRPDIRMTQPLLDIFQLPSVVVENARRAVTDIVETHLGQSMLCENLLERAGDVIRSAWLAVTPHKNIIRFRVGRTEIDSVLFLFFPEFQKKFFDLLQIGYTRRLVMLFVLSLAMIVFCFTTVCWIFSVSDSKSTASHFSPSTSDRRRP